MPDDIDDINIDDIDIDDINVENDDDESTDKKSGGKLKKFLLIGIVLAIVGGGAYYFMSDSADSKATSRTGGEESDEEEVERRVPYYFTLNPPFVVNFYGKGQAKFLQVKIEGLTRNASIKEDITTHLPHIRNNIVLLLSSKSYDDLITSEGKEALRKEVLVELKKILKKETGSDEIEDVFFTNFVMQ